MKLLVESPQHAPMVDPTTMNHIQGHRPSVIQNSAFAQRMIGEERITLLDELSDEADDDVFMAAHRVDPAKALAALPRFDAPAPVKKAK